MGFVRETGDPGLAAAVAGAAEAIETRREVQDSQQAREMAMTEQGLRQEQADLNSDIFNENLRRNRSDEARADLRLASESEARKGRQSLSEQKFELLKTEQDKERQLESSRSEANAIWLKALGDDATLSKEEYDVLIKSLRVFPQGVQTQILLKAKGLQREQQRVNRQKSEQDLGRSEQYILQSATTEADKMARAEALMEAKLLAGDDPTAYRNAVTRMQMELLQESGMRSEIERWGNEEPTKLSAAIGDLGERQEAFMLRKQVLEVGDTNPTDPRIKEWRDRIDWLKTPTDVRNRTQAAEQREREMASMMMMAGVHGQDQLRRLSLVNASQYAIATQAFGEEFAKTEQQRGIELTAALKAAGHDINLDVLLPSSIAPTPQLVHAFQAFDVAEVAMADLPADVRSAHQKGLFERAGVKMDKDAVDLYAKWKQDPDSFDASDVDEESLIEGRLYKAEKRKQRFPDDYDPEKSRGAIWIKKFKANEKLRKLGVQPADRIPLGPPPPGVEKLARSLGWGGGNSILDSVKETFSRDQLPEGAPSLLDIRMNGVPEGGFMPPRVDA